MMSDNDQFEDNINKFQLSQHRYQELIEHNKQLTKELEDMESIDNTNKLQLLQHRSQELIEHNKLLTKELEDMESIDLIGENGYVSATLLCKLGGKEFKAWHRLKRTTDVLNAYSQELGIPVNELIYIKKGGNNRDEQGSWVHPNIALSIAQWVSISFEIKVANWIHEWKSSSYKNEVTYVNSLKEIKSDHNKSCVEEEIQSELYNTLGGIIEVQTVFGTIDLLTETELIEIKDGNNWKHGMGQLLAYRKFYPLHKLRLHLFGIENNEEINSWCKEEYNIHVTYEV